MLHVDRILCPFEPTNASDLDAHPALAQSLYLADRLGASVYVLPFPTGAEPAGGAPSASSHSDAETRMAAVRDLAETSPMEARLVGPSADVPDRPSTDDLLAYASDHHIDLIVLDTPQDRGPIPPMASDPVRTIVERADSPVLVAARSPRPASFRRILAPVDFSEHSRESLQYAEFLADLYDASLDLLHVIERPQYVALNPTDMLAFSDATLMERKTRRRIQSFLDETSGDSRPAHLHLAHGDAADQIVHFTSEHPIDLVVLSTHGAIGRPQHPLGTVADKVLRRVACPVLLTRAFGRSLLSASSSDGAATQPAPSVDVRREE
jgi:nucleotide-binding universal stress UspA family protein